MANTTFGRLSSSTQGYKRPEAVLNFSHLIAAMGNTLNGIRFALTAASASGDEVGAA